MGETTRGRAVPLSKLSWDDLDAEEQHAVLFVARGWITGGRVWRLFFYAVTSVGVVAGAVYYLLSARDLMRGLHVP